MQSLSSPCIHIFDIVKREAARRQGEIDGETTPEEKKILEKVTGLPYERLWDKNNAGLRKRQGT